MEEIIIQWKLNRAVLASKIGMPKGTFNNKLSSKHPTKFCKEESVLLRIVLLELRADLDVSDQIGFNEALALIAKQNV